MEGDLRLHGENGKVCVSNDDLYYWFTDSRERNLFLEDFKGAINHDGCFTFPEGDSYTVTASNKRNKIVGCDRHGEVFVDEENRGFKKREKSLRNARIRIVAHHYDRMVTEMNGGPVSYGDGYISFMDWLMYQITENGAIGTDVFGPNGKFFDVVLPFPDELWATYRVHLMATYNLRGLPRP